MDNDIAQGTGTPKEARLHINILELRAVCLTCKAFLQLIHSLHIQIMSDYITTVICIIREGQDLIPSAWKPSDYGTDASGTVL